MALFGVSFPRREVTIRGEGIYLRACQMRDYGEWAALRERSRAFLTPWEPVWPHDDLTRMAFRFRVKRHAEEAARDEAYSYFIFREDDDALLGGLSLGHVRRGVSQAATLGYWMGQPYAGQGIMTRAVRATIAYAFEFQGLHRIEAACLPTNEPSKRLLQRVGFQQEGYARSYLSINGQWRDHLLFAILEGDVPSQLQPQLPKAG